ncbi:anaerobic ribonucleoside-triphosphate reductase activating protein [Asticcacaulis tiandongensis]|uniref:anaerobic ribonucleoside-triphosphate reductase activating protein n=1 Tax=Asticcacaulis tiandongensis TaxID=2565365 RepID=UPI00112DDAB8|nr:anaerobic ribonucleoside-triphosphate reductase activating protein [Asticcacaulis tiandongensis]
MWPKLPITSITPFTFQDFPERTACILWFSGCNMACGYCHNPELVKGTLARLPEPKITDFLNSRKGLLEGVVLSGGECTLANALPELCRYLKAMGFQVKIDTNGTRPEMIAHLLNQALVDFIALDFKAPERKYTAITHHADFSAFEHSLKLIASASIETEIRTTVHGDLLDTDDLNIMTAQLEALRYTGPYVVQNFRTVPTLGGLTTPQRPFNPADLTPRAFPTRLRNFKGL